MDLKKSASKMCGFLILFAGILLAGFTVYKDQAAIGLQFFQATLTAVVFLIVPKTATEAAKNIWGNKGATNV